MKSGLQSEIYDKFARATAGPSNPSIENWKKQGGKVLGYTCSFVPEELLIAAGLLPVRIRGTRKPDAGRADDYFQAANICSMVRHTFDSVLTGGYDFLDGAVIGGGCDGNRHILDNWEKCPIKTPFLHRIFFPHASDEPMAHYFRDQLADLKVKLEEHFAVTITDQKLWDAIKLCNEIRDCQKELYTLRKAANPPITGAETVAVMVAGGSLPKAEYLADLKQLLAEVRATPSPPRKCAARLMVVGPGHDEPSTCEIVENLGGLVVADLTCFGGKLIFGSVKESGPDPLQAIAAYQVLDRPFCPKNLGAHPHIHQVVFDAIRDFGVDGVIGQNFLCCDTWGGEIYILGKELKQSGIPLLRIEREYAADSSGQLSTRVQAFIETIAGGAL